MTYSYSSKVTGHYEHTELLMCMYWIYISATHQQWCGHSKDVTTQVQTASCVLWFYQTKSVAIVQTPFQTKFGQIHLWDLPFMCGTRSLQSLIVCVQAKAYDNCLCLQKQWKSQTSFLANHTEVEKRRKPVTMTFEANNLEDCTEEFTNEQQEV